MIRLFTTLLLLITLGACTQSPELAAPPQPQKGIDAALLLGSEPRHMMTDKGLVVLRDPGGLLYGRMRFLSYLERKDIRVHVMGRCVSACTLYLSLDNVCVSPNATFGFHGPSASDAYATSAQREDDLDIMLDLYPDFLDEWFLENAAQLIRKDLAWITGTEMIRLGIDNCDSKSSQAR